MAWKSTGAHGATLINCLFANNAANDEGGAIAPGVDGDIINCTFWGNSAAAGRAIYAKEPGTIVTNSILWGVPGAAQIVTEPPVLVTVRYSDVQGGWPGLNNINADPLFFDSAAGNFRLRNECPVVSPCIDAGSDAAVPCDEFDLDDDDVFGCPASGGELLPWDRDKKTIFTNSHHGRILNVATGDGTEVDMGAYESQHITARRWDIAGNAGGPWPDFVVGTPDLLLLLQDWSVGGRTCSGCGADFDYSQFVDTVDFLVLLTNWCPPCPPPCVPMEGQGDSMASASGYSEFSESPVDGALAVMGFSSLDDYGAWLEQASPVQAYASGVVMAVLLGG